MSGNSWNGKSGDGIRTGTGSETEVALSGVGTWTILSIFILSICGCAVEGLYSFGYPFSSKKSVSNGAAAAAA